MRILSIDYGTKYTGIAISNKKGTIAFPFAIIKNNKMLINKIKQIVKEEGIEKIIIGDPKYNKNTKFYSKLNSFINELKNHIDIKIERIDELLTSKDAENRYKQKKAHKFAAMLILENYINTRC